MQGACTSADFLKLCFFLLLIGLLFTGCASVPIDYPRTQSSAFTNHLDTSVGQLFEEAAVLHPGESGFAIIRRGRPAFTSRIPTCSVDGYIIGGWPQDIRERKHVAGGHSSQVST